MPVDSVWRERIKWAIQFSHIHFFSFGTTLKSNNLYHFLSFTNFHVLLKTIRVSCLLIVDFKCKTLSSAANCTMQILTVFNLLSQRGGWEGQDLPSQAKGCGIYISIKLSFPSKQWEGLRDAGMNFIGYLFRPVQCHLCAAFHREGQVRWGVEGQLARGECGCEDLLLPGWEVLVQGNRIVQHGDAEARKYFR